MPTQRLPQGPFFLQKESNLWHVMHRDTAELIRKVYETQKLQNSKTDWVEILVTVKKQKCPSLGKS